MAFPIEHLRNVETRIGVAVGVNKAMSILGALIGNLINVLITDSVTADAILNHDREYSAF